MHVPGLAALFSTSALAVLAGFGFHRQATQPLPIRVTPEQLEILAEVPRNPTGKILKHELRKKYADS